MDKNTIHLWGRDGAIGGSVTIHPNGCKEATVIQVSLTYIGLLNTDYWLGRVREGIESIFQKEFDEHTKAGE